MGAMGADRELNLQQQLLGRLALRVLTPPQLAANLRELAWPEGQKERLPSVALRCVVRPLAVGQAHVEVRRLGQVAEDPVTAVVSEVAPLCRGEEPSGVTPEDLHRRLREDVARQWHEASNREARPDPALLAPEKV